MAEFIKLMGINPIGSLARLNSGRLAVVTENHENALQNPVVKVFYSTKSNARVKVERLDLNDNTVTDRIASRETAGRPIIWTNCVACASPLTGKASNWWSGLKQEYID